MSRLWCLLAVVCAVGLLPGRAEASVAQWQQGMSFAAWWHDEYARLSTQRSLTQLAGLKGNWVAIIPAWVMKDKRDNNIAPTTRTATDASVRQIIYKAHARGLKVMLKPHVDQDDKSWRGEIQPTNPDLWFANYRRFLLHYATIAAQSGAEQLCIGTELKTMTEPRYAGRWRSMIAEVRRVYKGKLTYAANWGPKAWAEYYQIPWWNALDYIGVDAYFPLVHVLSPSVAQVMAGWRSYDDPSGSTFNWVADMKALSQRFNKKVLFTEIGFESNPRAGNLWHLRGPTRPDMAAQRNCIEATFRVFDKESWVAGIYWWTWGVNPSDGGPNDVSMWLNRKPAAETVRSWYARTR